MAGGQGRAPHDCAVTMAVMRMQILKRKEINWHGWEAKAESERRMPSLGGVVQTAWISCSNRAA